MELTNKNKVGIVFGLFLASWHFLWSLMVISGLAQGFLDWIYSIHFLNNPFIVEDFALMTAITLIVALFIIGYIFGYFLAILWNAMHKRT